MQNKTEKSKASRCRYCHRFMGKQYNEKHCVADGYEDSKVKVVSEEECENCSRFDSRFIEFPLTIKDIVNEKINTSGLGHEVGCLCEIVPCGKEYNNKSYIGIYLGNLPVSIQTFYDRRTGVLTNSTMNNPAIFVPELKKIIYGLESWWRVIDTIDDFKGITKEDIDNTWYVKLLKLMSEGGDKNE